MGMFRGSRFQVLYPFPIYSLWMMYYYLEKIFGGEWTCLHDIIFVFCLATEMEISNIKSNFLAPRGLVDRQILDLLPINCVALKEGFMYLGYTLKPLGYKKWDWE